MNIAFLNPFLLFGLAAAALPILIHRITRKRAAVLKFSAVYLLLQSQQIRARPRRLKNLLILALRLLAVITVVLMVARPMLVRSGAGVLGRQGAAVLILDNSMGMAYQEDRGSRYDVSKRAVREFLEDFEGQVALIPTADIPPGRELRWLGAGEALTELDKLRPSLSRGNMTAAFTLAYQQLKHVKVPRQILVFSDMARTDLSDLDLAKLGVISEAEVTFFNMSGPGRHANRCIKNVRLEEEALVAGVPGRMEVTVSNFSDQGQGALVTVSLGGRKVDQKSVDLRPGQDEKIFFDLLVREPGWVDGEVALNADRLAVDDRFFFPIKVKEKTRVLIVDGDPKTALKLSESFYLAGALQPGGSGDSPFQVRVATSDEMARMDLSRYHILFLLNVARPDFSRVAAFLEMEKPVLFFLGDRIEPEAYNAFSLAPWRIGEIVTSNGKAEKEMPTGFMGGKSSFLAGLEENIQRAAFYRYFKIEGSENNIITLKDRHPLLTEAAVGEARMFLYASSADIDWNDLPLKAAFVPFVHELIKAARGDSEPSFTASLRIGDPVEKEGVPLRILGDLAGPGIVQLRLPRGTIRRGMNTPPEESDLTMLSPGELKKKFGLIGANVVGYEAGGLKALGGGRKDLWPYFLGFLFMVLAVETVVADRIIQFRKDSGTEEKITP